MEEQIPEWKRNAVVLQEDSEQEEESQGMLKRARSKLGEKINETQAAQNFY